MTAKKRCKTNVARTLYDLVYGQTEMKVTIEHWLLVNRLVAKAKKKGGGYIDNSVEIVTPWHALKQFSLPLSR